MQKVGDFEVPDHIYVVTLNALVQHRRGQTHNPFYTSLYGAKQAAKDLMRRFPKLQVEIYGIPIDKTAWLQYIKLQKG